MEELNVLYQFDNNSAPYAGISILSLFENNKGIKHLNVYCAAMGVDGRNTALLNETASKYGRNITYVDVRRAVEQMQRIHVGSWNGSVATWLKIFVLENFIGKMDSLLYIDSDTLVQGGLDGLYNFDFEGKAAACVLDSLYSLGFWHCDRLQMQKDRHYYNAGVVFFNLAYFGIHREAYAEMIGCLKKNVWKYLANEQDLLNEFFCGKIKRLGTEYNFQGIHLMYSDKAYFRMRRRGDYYLENEVAGARGKIKILHFFRVLGDYPWAEGNCHPAQEEFQRWKQISLWQGEPDIRKKRGVVFRAERLLYRVLPEKLFLRLFWCITNGMDRIRNRKAHAAAGRAREG